MDKPKPYWTTTRLLCTVGIVLAILNGPHIATDDSDAGPWDRSGVSVITDHKTGLQYLSTWSGNITPRLMPDGTQVTAAKASRD